MPGIYEAKKHGRSFTRRPVDPGGSREGVPEPPASGTITAIPGMIGKCACLDQRQSLVRFLVKHDMTMHKGVYFTAVCKIHASNFKGDR